MKFINTLVITSIICAVSAQADNTFANFQEANQGILSAYGNAFSQPNLYAPLVKKEAIDIWMTAINKAKVFIQSLLDKQRSFGQNISASNRDLITKSQLEIGTTNKAVASMLEDISNIDTAFITKQTDTLKRLQNDLKPALLDIQDTKDIKQLLTTIMDRLQNTLERVKSSERKPENQPQDQLKSLPLRTELLNRLTELMKKSENHSNKKLASDIRVLNAEIKNETAGITKKQYDYFKKDIENFEKQVNQG